MQDKDEVHYNESTITIEPDAIEVKTDYEFFARYIVARGFDNAGDEIYFFTGCDKLVIHRNWQREIIGAILVNRGVTKYFGIDPELHDRLSGWTKRSK